MVEAYHAGKSCLLGRPLRDQNAEKTVGRCVKDTQVRRSKRGIIRQALEVPVYAESIIGDMRLTARCLR